MSNLRPWVYDIAFGRGVRDFSNLTLLHLTHCQAQNEWQGNISGGNHAPRCFDSSKTALKNLGRKDLKLLRQAREFQVFRAFSQHIKLKPGDRQWGV
jgi:hypothetical protein